MRTLPWLSLSTLLVLASTGCPAADEGQDTDGSSSTTGDDSDSTTMTTTTASTTVSTSDSTSASTTVSTTDSTTDSTTVSTTDSTESSGSTDPDTSGGESSTAESGGSSSGGSDSTGTDTGTGDCKPSGDACEDCYVVDNCCADFTACFEDADCTCLLTCIGGGMDPADCFGDMKGQCNLDQSPEPFDLLVECLNDADAACAEVCA